MRGGEANAAVDHAAALVKMLTLLPSRRSPYGERCRPSARNPCG